MGQYYHAVSLDANQFLMAHDHCGKKEDGGLNGLKLMEHSYIRNPLTAAVESLLMKGGAWYGHRIVWAGDYADPEPETVTEKNKRGQNLYDLIRNKLIVDVEDQKRKGHLRYLVNLDKNLFVDLNKIPKIPDWGVRIHPLPLLTCEGNGRGNGDFRYDYDEKPEYDKLIGSWARDRIAMEGKKPKDKEELIFDIVEP